MLSDALRHQLIHGRSLPGGLRLGALSIDDLDEVMALLELNLSLLKQAGAGAFMHSPTRAAQAQMLAPPGASLGEGGLMVGARAEDGEGPLIACATLDLVGPVTPLAPHEIHNLRLDRARCAYTRSTVVHPSYRRRQLAHHMLTLRLRVAEELGMVLCTSTGCKNRASQGMASKVGLLMVDIGENPKAPGAWTFVWAARPAPGERFILDEESPPEIVPYLESPEACRAAFARGQVGVAVSEAGVVMRRLLTPTPPPGA